MRLCRLLVPVTLPRCRRAGGAVGPSGRERPVPYVICGDCKVVTYSAELWAITDQCPRCDTPLPSGARAELLAVAARANLCAPPTDGAGPLARVGSGDDA
jgi:hypothetical protein